jgi:hypothetical protein
MTMPHQNPNRHIASAATIQNMTPTARTVGGDRLAATPQAHSAAPAKYP